MADSIIKLFNMSINASWLIIAAIILRFLLKKTPKNITICLWGLVGIRLVCPFSLSSIFSLIPSAEPIPNSLLNSYEPSIDTGFNAVNEVINPAIQQGIAKQATSLDNLLFAAAVIWCIGIISMIIYSAVSFSKLHKKVSASIRMEDNIYICDNIKTPFILGIFKPKIYLPSDITKTQIESVIAHEKAHIKRFDHIVKLLGFGVLSIHWFNPLVWAAYILFCRDIEFACDEKAIKSMKNDAKKTYTETLLELSMPGNNFSVCPLSFGEVGVKNRIKSVLNYKKPTLWIILIAAVAIIAIAVSFATNPVTTVSKINGRLYAPEKYYYDDLIGAARANSEEKTRRYYISEDFVISKYDDDGLNYQINIQGKLKKQENFYKNLFTPIVEKLPKSYSSDKIEEMYIAEVDNMLTTPKDLFVLLKFRNNKLILSYLSHSNSNYYARDVISLKPLKSTQLDSRSAITGTSGSTNCDGVSVKIAEAVYFGEKPYIKVQWENNSGNALVYGEDFYVYKNENGKKIPVNKTDLVFTLIAYTSRDQIGEKICSLDNVDLSSTGSYILEFGFTLENTKEKKYTASLEFEIADVPSSETAETPTSSPSAKPESPSTSAESTTLSIAVGATE